MGSRPQRGSAGDDQFYRCPQLQEENDRGKKMRQRVLRVTVQEGNYIYYSFCIVKDIIKRLVFVNFRIIRTVGLLYSCTAYQTFTFTVSRDGGAFFLPEKSLG